METTSRAVASPKTVRGFLAAAALALVSGCDVVGACLHEYKDPVLALRLQVSGSAPPMTIRLTDVRLGGGRPLQDVRYLVGPPAYRARAVADTVECDAPCGFAFDEGRYAFVAIAAGFRPESVTVEARYDAFHGGCPSSNAGSTVLTVPLVPASQ